MTRYACPFPRLNEDILTKKRTLVHLPIEKNVAAWRDLMVGDTIDIVAKAGDSPVAAVVVTSVKKVRLADSLTEDEDWLLLNLPRGSSRIDADSLFSYSQRWNAANPEDPWELNPLVWRIEFRYLDDVPFTFALAN